MQPTPVSVLEFLFAFIFARLFGVFAKVTCNSDATYICRWRGHTYMATTSKVYDPVIKEPDHAR